MFLSLMLVFYSPLASKAWNQNCVEQKLVFIAAGRSDSRVGCADVVCRPEILQSSFSGDFHTVSHII